ncbi:MULTISPECIES: ACT domain-containing protein [unclassified Aeromicrobium]|uniref:ACT domain-containing protein n=1 Tax=unclassified Aeromicrobium TaxID=2633570 RepID=UPI000ADE6BDF|nr:MULTISPECIES: ACT domain-containing protein [unclassified Aeromicrobium]MCX6408174.1 ACT domain-containing protein [Propionibacteriales bacterium]
MELEDEARTTSAVGELRPRLHPEPVVYAIVAPGFDTSTALATVREREGLTVVVEQVEAEEDGLVYEFVGAWITLAVVSALDAVGLTSSISTALAAEQIACNVVAGFHHDHLVVPWDRRHDALRILDALG